MSETKRLFNIYGHSGGNFAGNVYDPNGIAPAIRTYGGGSQQPIIIETDMAQTDHQIQLSAELQGKKFRIRKLTPRECFRLMDVDDKDIDKIQATGLSNSAQYRLAGNSIVVNVLFHIFRRLFIDTGRPDDADTAAQLSLF